MFVITKQTTKLQGTAEKQKVIIFVDRREGSSGILNELANFNCDIKEVTLAVGDFILSDRVVVERKRYEDFIQSIIDSRLFRQLQILKQNFEKPILIVEGNSTFRKNLCINAIRGALASVVLDYSVPILWTKNLEETAGIIYWIAKREQIKEKRMVRLRGKVKGTNLKENQEFLVSGLPGISTIRAREILKYFGSPLRFFLATEKEIKKVKNIGEKTAKNIRKILESKYEK